MNIFYLDHDPEICAKMHCDKHVVKMIIEYAQLMSTAHRILDGVQQVEKRYVHGSLPARWRNVKVWIHPNNELNTKLMKACHMNHPSTVWVRATHLNYKWLYEMWCHLLQEYTYRYGRIHSCARLKDTLKKMPENIILALHHSEPTQAMPEYCKIKNDSISAYHKYYINEKVRFARWTNREIPSWFKKGTMNANIQLSA